MGLIEKIKLLFVMIGFNGFSDTPINAQIENDNNNKILDGVKDIFSGDTKLSEKDLSR